jgi:hypothetical protein
VSVVGKRFGDIIPIPSTSQAKKVKERSRLHDTPENNTKIKERKASTSGRRNENAKQLTNNRRRQATNHGADQEC